MPFRRPRSSRKLALIPIDSIKNVFQSVGTVAGSAVQVLAVATGDDPVNCTLANQGGNAPKVEDGAAIRSIELQLTLYLSAAPAAVRHFYVFMRKNEKGLLPVPTLANMGAIGQVAWKDRIFHGEQAQAGVFTVGGVPMVFHIRLRIPKRFHRIEKSDIWEVFFAHDGVAGETLDYCAIATYKWYR